MNTKKEKHYLSCWIADAIPTLSLSLWLICTLTSVFNVGRLSTHITAAGVSMICPQRVCSSDGYVDEHSEMRSLWRVISGEYLRAIQLIPVTFYFKIDVRGGAEGLLSRRDFWFWGCKKPRPSSAHHVQGKIGSEPHSSVPPFSFYNSSFSDPSPLWYCFAHAPISSHSQLCVRLRSFTSATTYCNLSPPRKILSTLLSRPDNISKCRKSLLWRM